MYDLHITTFNCVVVLRCFTYIIVADSDLPHYIIYTQHILAL